MPANGNLTGNSVVDLYNRIEIECGKAESKLGKHLIFAVIIGVGIAFTCTYHEGTARVIHTYIHMYMHTMHL